MKRHIPTTLYHYCSLSTFQKIIESQSIWLSDISKSNDSLEMKWIYSQFMIYFLEMQNNYLKKKIALSKHITKLRQEGVAEKDLPVSQEYNSMEFDNLKEFIGRMQKIPIYNSFVFCLSELSDSLSQWRGYADDGHGIALGFKGSYLSKFNGFDGTPIQGMFSIDKISYGSLPAQKYFDTNSEFEKISIDSTSSDIKNIVQTATLNISRRAAFFKSASFKEEREWRMAITLRRFKVNNEYFDISELEKVTKEGYAGRYHVKKFGFTSTRDKLIPHIELYFPDMKKALKRIYIGPKSSVTPEDIRMFLIANGFLSSTEDKSIEILFSSSSYR